MPRILVTDDDETIRHSLQEGLERAGHTVVLAADGVEALERIGERRPDLIVLDIMMPRKDGFEVLKELKAQPRTASIPLVLLLARAADPTLFEGCTWAPGDFYVTKPFLPAALASRLIRLLQGDGLAASSGRLDLELLPFA
jgi:CheY-like chemotaxis protein